ncbi:MAG: hypothetical protein JSS81_23355 [Acidobacteria bacterium]|nr:hypothetical protein [Acidobacteriota bacterium]
MLKNSTFFIDRSSGKGSFVEGLKLLGLNIEIHDDHFESNEKDVVWLCKCGEMNWIVISSDKKIKKNPFEREALIRARTGTFFFTSGEISNKEKIEFFRLALKQIAKIVMNENRPFIARINRDGTAEVWVNHKNEDCLAKKQKRTS